MPRPALDDEHARIHLWQESLDKHGGDRQEVIRSAASALALRDAEIARLLRVVSELAPPRRGGTKECSHG